MASSSRTYRIDTFCKTCKVYGAYHDSRHCKIKKEFNPPSTVPKFPKSEPQEVGPNPIPHTFQIKSEYAPKPDISVEELPPETTQDVAFWSEVCSFCDSISSSDRSFNQIPTLRSPSLRAESLNTFMFCDNHNPWEDELSQDSDYTPFEDEFSQDEINTILNNKQDVLHMLAMDLSFQCF
ncbi:hypothetical protein L1987_64435 [Smallanthus sonchifolius]|uniref:Uncharacterized protein n=1 Tax=Smallanthus sonchifolius TaxID=185202 RepID=A0ACB9CG45_9ASTR|nr:hypothetical protein L1987_64435 [Smallanthus sonchifolius]